jgi:hypothetical protein
MNNINILIGGKLGDFLLGVYGAQLLCRSKNIKANIYMIDIGWDFGIRPTYDALYPILKNQAYINDFQILTDYYLDPIQTPTQNSPIRVHNEKLNNEGYIVDDYLNSKLLYKNCWSDIYSDMYKTPPIIDNIWLEFDKIDSKFKNSVIIHRKFSTERFNNEFPYDQIINNYDSVFFVSTNKNDYDQFPLKQNIEFIQVENLEQWFTIINSCSMYVGNLTAPVVIAQALNKLRIIELPFNEDAMHWMGEEKYSTNIKWFLNRNTHNLN